MNRPLTPDEQRRLNLAAADTLRALLNGELTDDVDERFAFSPDDLYADLYKTPDVDPDEWDDDPYDPRWDD